MSHDATKSARVVRVAAGVESTSQAVPVRDARHETLAVLIGRWGSTKAAASRATCSGGAATGRAAP